MKTSMRGVQDIDVAFDSKRWNDFSVRIGLRTEQFGRNWKGIWFFLKILNWVKEKKTTGMYNDREPRGMGAWGPKAELMMEAIYLSRGQWPLRCPYLPHQELHKTSISFTGDQSLFHTPYYKLTIVHRRG